MRGIKPPALFELRAHEWRNAVDLHHLPEGTHCLANRPGSLDRWTFQIGPRGRPRTCNLSVLSGTSLLIGLHAVGSPGRSSERRLVPREGFPPPTSPF